jgi:transcriptional pleiotropic regulator of transition state genes
VTQPVTQPKNIGMARKVDQLGRIVLPSELRRLFGIREGDLVEIFVDEDRIVLSKLEDRCVFCGSHQDLHEFSGKLVCSSCSQAVGNLT